MHFFSKQSRDLNKFIRPIVKLHGMCIILGLILLFSTTCYSTPGWAEEFIMTSDSNVVMTSETDNGIVITKWRGDQYYVTNLVKYSYSFYPNYILGKCDKGLFAFNETTYEVDYFEKIEELDRFKLEKNLVYSNSEKRQILIKSLLISFFALLIIFFIVIYLKNKETDIIQLRKKLAIYYVIVFLATKIFNMIFAHVFLFNPNKLFSPQDNVLSILLYSLFLAYPWYIIYADYKRVHCVNKLRANSILFILFLILDFGVITTSYYFSGLFRHYVIFFVLLCNLPLIVFYWIPSSVSNKIKKSRLGNRIRK